MTTAAKTKRHAKYRALLEELAVGPASAPALKIDRALKIIYGVKVLGRYSRNNHGLTEAVNGTEYSPACMRAALADYEGAKVKVDHPPDRTKPGAERSVEATFGVLRDVRIESEDDGIRGDLHYFDDHPMCGRVLDDIDRRMGVFGLSHNASAARERFDAGAKRLVIEELAQVRSVDLVDKPATNRNLWESEHRSVKTWRELLEAAAKTPVRKKWIRPLLEDDAMAPTMDAPMEADSGSEEDALWNGFVSACTAIIQGDGTAAEKGKKITDYLKAHEKLTQAAEPEEPVEESCEPDKPGDKKDKKDAMESEELTTLRAEKAARELCESLDLKHPTSVQVAAVAGIKDGKQKRELIESFKGTPTPGSRFKPPKSAAPGAIKPPAKKAGDAARETPESEVVPADEGMRVLMGG